VIPATLPAQLRASAERFGERPAIVAGATRTTYSELDRAVDAFAARLLELGVRRGDRVAVALPNGVEPAIAIYGAMRAGAAVTPLNPTARAGRLAQLVEHSGAIVAVCAAESAEAALAGGALHALTGEDLAAVPPRAPGPMPGVLEVDLASIIYTSGSTGAPKGVAFLQRNMSFVAGSIVEYLGLHADDRILCPLPLSHTYGLYQLVLAVRLGATLVLEALTFPGRLVEALERERTTVLPGVPTTWQVLISLHGLAERELPHLRLLTNAGASLSVAQLAEVRRTFPAARMFSMYGQTECKRVCYLPPEELDARPGSVGVAIPGTEVWLEDDTGAEPPPGEVGELIVRGDHVMQGYWKDPEATARKLVAGRMPGDRALRTGDLFRRDEAGYLYFVARTDDMIVTRGEKVAPKEVEEVLHAVAGVHEAAVVGAPDELLGEAVIAHVAGNGAGIDPQALRRHCREQLEDFKVPKRVVVHDTLPKTDNGKLDKAALRAG